MTSYVKQCRNEMTTCRAANQGVLIGVNYLHNCSECSKNIWIMFQFCQFEFFEMFQMCSNNNRWNSHEFQYLIAFQSNQSDGLLTSLFAIAFVRVNQHSIHWILVSVPDQPTGLMWIDSAVGGATLIGLQFAERLRSRWKPRSMTTDTQSEVQSKFCLTEVSPFPRAPQQDENWKNERAVF